MDALGNVYTVEATANQRVQKFTSSGGFVTKWGSYGTCDGMFEGPTGMGVDGSGAVYVADNGDDRVQKFTGDGVFVTKWGSWTAPCAPGDWQDDWLHVVDVAPDGSGRVFATDPGNFVDSYSDAGEPLNSWGGPGGSGPGQFNVPWGIAVDATGRIYVADMLNNRVQVFSSGGTYLAQVGSLGTGDGQFDGLKFLAVDAQGNLFVSDTNNHRVQKFATSGPTPAIRTTFGSIKARYR